MADKYIYLFLSFYLLVLWLMIIIFRKDLVRKVIKASIGGGFAGLIAEVWYFVDYWQPPSLAGVSSVSIEDFLFGFCITGIAVSIFDVTFCKKIRDEAKDRKGVFFILFLCGLISLLVFNNWLGINSIFVSSMAFIVISVIMILIRRDLFLPSIISGILTVIVIIPIYLLLYNWLSPDYWMRYWLLYDTEYGITVLGNIPVTEIIWYFSWGCLAGAGYDFASGKIKV
ncbi:MAG: lycopene cyclase domain-containing protein [Spirochaetota bacterium]|nr:lycopene cyclase domain-containing protein [Spirochaetota bacterium]